ncbi:MAG TPA: serine protease [Pirellulales bacterium]|jgi:hypothetical protein|nr:serine protease [Pirellulales bacterium]
MKTFCCLKNACVAALILSATLTASQALADAKTYQDTVVSTAWVLAKSDGKTSSGTGVLIDAEKKMMLTNFHVVGEARLAIVFFPVMTDGKLEVERKYYLDNVKTVGIRGRVIGIDRKRDLALVQLDRIPEGVKAITMAKASPTPGENVQSVGNSGSTDVLWVYTSGTVRAVYKKQFRTGAGDHDFTVVETQSPINTGDSGGPVVNKDGELVAISQAISPSARLVTYSVDISEVRAFLAGPWKPAPLPIADIIERAELTTTDAPGNFLEVKCDQEDKTVQSVFIAKELEYYEKADTRKVWALASVLKQAPKTEVLMKLMDQNARTKLGAWSIEQNAQGEFLVVYCAKIDASAAPDALRSTTEYVAKLTALMKKDLAPKDEKVKNPNEKIDEWLKK